MRELTIDVAGLSLKAVLYDTPTADAIWKALPIEAAANVWGEEIYFDVDVSLPGEPDAREVVTVGALAYWPAGPAFCIFFGPTPVSTGDEPRAYSPVNVFGEIQGDATVLTSVAQGAQVTVSR